MNPSNPYPNPHHQPFPYRPPPNPNPNPNPSFLSHPPPQIPPPPTSTFSSVPNTASSSFPDLPSTLSSLTHLLSLSNQTLSSPQTALLKAQNSELIACPYNPHHLMPPQSLFLHSLRCPSPLLENPSSLLDSLHYPKTLNPENPATDPDHSSYPAEDTGGTEHVLSLEHYYNEFSMNFFYKDCPGVVNINDLDSSRKTFSLPGVLSAACANFVSGGYEGEDKHFDGSGFRVLASSSLAIRREMEGWTDYPCLCSYDLFCAVLRLNVTKLSDLKRWIISNSPRYGVVFDVYMTDHISVLFRLCLRAIRKEALALMTFKENAKASSFECPVLVQVLKWIASQLSVLFGELNAKYFSLHTFKQCVLEASKGVLFFPLESIESSEDPEDNKSDIRDITNRKKDEEPGDGSEDCNVGKRVDESIDKDVIFMSQVVAAVGALHERSLLETKIKALRVSQLPPRYVRMAAHALASKRADEERKKRPNYRAIIEHDGLLRKPSSNEGTSKSKTREELLAEERDYKRRRMSYRGKKLKRTPLQVLRDIIDEYTEEIKQAGGIGIFDKDEDEETSLQPSISYSSVDFHKPRKGNNDSSEVKWTAENQDKKLSLHDQNIGSTTLRDDLPQEYEKRGWEHHVRRKYLEAQRSGRDRHDSDSHFKCPEKHRNHESTHKQTTHREEQSEIFTRYDHYEKRSGKSSSHGCKSSSLGLDSAVNVGIHKEDQKLNARDSHPGYPFGNHRSSSLPQHSFEDRYDPTECHDMYEDNVYSDVKYVRQEKYN